MNPRQRRQQQQPQERRRRQLTIFWEGTANSLELRDTQIGLFADACCASRVASPDRVPCDGPVKMAFDGCGVTNDILGLLFGAGLDGQANLAVQVVERMLEQQEESTSNIDSGLPREKGVHVVAVGLSRGGMACMKLAQKLAEQFPNNNRKQQQPVTASMLLFDPVPGNAISTGFPWTASWSQDLSQCHNLVRVLAMYPYEALPDLAMHAPTLCRYNHNTTLVQEDVTLGCHQGSLMIFRACPLPANPYQRASNLSLRRVYDYLESEGVSLQLPREIIIPSAEDCITLMQTVLIEQTTHKEALRRKTHDQTGQNRVILRHTAMSRCQWLNKHHEQLANALQKHADEKDPDGSSSSNPTATRTAVFGDPTNSAEANQQSAARPYHLDFDDGHVTCSLGRVMSPTK